MPGHLGGAQWHGGSFDPQLNVLYVNVNEVPTINRLKPIYSSDDGRAGGKPSERTQAQLGRQIYDTNCMSCHGGDRKGSPPIVPALLNSKLTPQQFRTVVLEGRNIMPAFRQFRAQELDALLAYLSSVPEVGGGGGTARRYSVDGYIQFADKRGVPLIAPPWGTLNAIDLIKGEKIQLIINTPQGADPWFDEKAIRRASILHRIPAITTIAAARAAAEGIAALQRRHVSVHALQQLHADRLPRAVQ